MPTVPVNAAGWRIEPPVSVAVAPMHSRAATAEADPPDEPPGTRCAPSIWPLAAAPTLEPSRRHGLTTGPKQEVSFDEPIANSSLLSLPRIFEHAVVRTFLVANRSLIPSGMPPSGPPLPLAILASASRATARA